MYALMMVFGVDVVTVAVADVAVISTLGGDVVGYGICGCDEVRVVVDTGIAAIVGPYGVVDVGVAGSW